MSKRTYTNAEAAVIGVACLGLALMVVVLATARGETMEPFVFWTIGAVLGALSLGAVIEGAIKRALAERQAPKRRQRERD